MFYSMATGGNSGGAGGEGTDAGKHAGSKEAIKPEKKA